MHFSITREQLLPPLQLVSGIVERKQTLPMLANVLFTIEGDELSLLASDLEVELIGKLNLVNQANAIRIAIPTRKVLDICRALPETSVIDFFVENQKVTIKSGRSRFTLSAFQAEDFPYIDSQASTAQFIIPQKDFRYLLEKTQFAMAQQDVRYYLNGLLLEANNNFIKAVATDGHRLAISALKHAQQLTPFQIIIPRKAITELMRLLDSQSEEPITLLIGSNFFRVMTQQYIFTTRLIDGPFPAYEKVIPKNNNKEMTIDKDIFKQALSRAAILANAKLKGICLQLRTDLLRITAYNSEQDQAEEEIPANYAGIELDIGLNVTYLLDVINVTPTAELRLNFYDANSCVLIEEQSNTDNCYIIMPMRV